MTTNLTDRALALADTIDKATPGPWEISQIKGVRGHVMFVGPITGDDYCELRIEDEDARAIVAARNDAPALLRELAGEIERLRAALTEIAGCHPGFSCAVLAQNALEPEETK